LKAGLTQSQLVRVSGIPKPTLSRYENDHVTPSLSTLRRLAKALNVPESTLIGEERTPEAELLDALRERGIEVRTRAEARRLADIFAKSVAAAFSDVASRSRPRRTRTSS
jgi:transcriptional regulator with XRE-family HTH domain